MRKRALEVLIIMLCITFVSISAPGILFPGGKAKDHPMRSPIRLTQLPERNLLVSDYRLGMVLEVNRKTLEVIRWFRVMGKPLGIAYAGGHIFVGNETAGCVEVYTRPGKKMVSVGAPGSIRKPTDMAVDLELKRLFVVDGYRKTVKVFSLKGNAKLSILPILSFPAAGEENKLVNPTGICLDERRQRVYVSDYGDDVKGIVPRVQIFDYNGAHVGTISGKAGMFGRRFSRPQGLAVNAAGNLFLLDCFASEILVFNPDTGVLLKTFGGFGTGPGQLQLPLDLVIDAKSNDVYVTNNRAARIEVFTKGGEL